MVLVGDYSFARPDPATLAANYEGVMRYVGGNPAKRMSVGERDALFAAGLSIGIVFEGGTSNVLGANQAGWPSIGAATLQGQIDGSAAAAQVATFGFPPDRPIYYAADTDVLDAQWPIVAAYLDAARVGSGSRVVQGIYGGSGLCEQMFVGGHAEFTWTSGATAWDHGHPRPAPSSCLLQLTTGPAVPGCDDNDKLLADWGQWGSIIPPPPPPEKKGGMVPTVYFSPGDTQAFIFDRTLWAEVDLFTGIGAVAAGAIEVHVFDADAWERIRLRLQKQYGDPSPLKPTIVLPS